MAHSGVSDRHEAKRKPLRILVSPWTYLGMAVVIMALDVVLGRYLQFPILFILPATLCAWFYSVRWAYALAVLLPLARLYTALFLHQPSPTIFSLINAAVRIAVLVLIAYLTGRTSRQTKQLNEKYEGLVNMCAWTRTVEYKGEWLSFEGYLKKRFNLETSHGISPVEAEKLIKTIEESKKINSNP